MDFKLNAPFQPTGDQPEAVKQLVEGVQRGLKHQVLLMEFIEAHLHELAHLADAQGATGSPGEPGHGHDQERV